VTLTECAEGTVVVVDTGQAGTVIHASQTMLMVCLANSDMWYGAPSQAYLPTTREELDAAPLNIDRFSQSRRRKFSPARQDFDD
jgi:hypothetical protein